MTRDRSNIDQRNASALDEIWSSSPSVSVPRPSRRESPNANREAMRPTASLTAGGRRLVRDRRLLHRPAPASRGTMQSQNCVTLTLARAPCSVTSTAISPPVLPRPTTSTLWSRNISPSRYHCYGELDREIRTRRASGPNRKAIIAGRNDEMPGPPSVRRRARRPHIRFSADPPSHRHRFGSEDRMLSGSPRDIRRPVRAERIGASLWKRYVR